MLEMLESSKKNPVAFFSFKRMVVAGRARTGSSIWIHLLTWSRSGRPDPLSLEPFQAVVRTSACQCCLYAQRQKTLRPPMHILYVICPRMPYLSLQIVETIRLSINWVSLVSLDESTLFSRSWDLYTNWLRADCNQNRTLDFLNMR